MVVACQTPLASITRVSEEAGVDRREDNPVLVEQRDRIIARLYTASAAPGTNQGNIALMIRELARTLTR